jgi:hypothetical protein
LLSQKGIVLTYDMQLVFWNTNEFRNIFIKTFEQIRQLETEVRWQNEKDVNDCHGCKQPFSVTKHKVVLMI